VLSIASNSGIGFQSIDEWCRYLFSTCQKSSALLVLESNGERCGRLRFPARRRIPDFDKFASITRNVELLGSSDSAASNSVSAVRRAFGRLISA